jgi:uncharacterized protein (DUF1330 family)
VITRTAWNKNFVIKDCLCCGKMFETPQWRINQGKGKYCSRECAAKCNIAIGRASYKYVPPKGITPKHLRKYCREDNFNWHGGRFLDKDGYVMILSVDHPNKNGRGYVQEHRLVIEKKIGRYLNKEESVHHKNKNKQDNSLENLMLFKNISAHRRFESGGIVNAEEIIFNYEINLKAL